MFKYSIGKVKGDELDDIIDIDRLEEEECEKYCKAHGYKKSKNLFDGGYSVSKNPNFYKE